MATISVSAHLLELAARRNNFALPADELVFFGIRGTIPEKAASTQFSKEHSVNFAEIDHRRMRCVIGQWNRKDGTVALFPGSTVPSAASVEAARKVGGAGANLLLPGRYEHRKGIHKEGKPGGHRAFRQNRFFPVRRTSNNTTYDNFDRIDLGDSASSFVWDNIHSAYYDEPGGRFSSAGCQVVCGLPKSAARSNAPETGPWKTFIDNAYTLFSAQDRFVYLLFTAAELGVVANNDATKIQQLVMFGSSGALAKKVQDALIASGDLSGDSDGDFGRQSLKALIQFQTKKFGPGSVDGVCGPNTAAALSIKLPLLSTAKPPSQVPVAELASGPANDIPDETDISQGELHAILVKLGLIEAPQLPAQPPLPQPGQPPAASFDAFFKAIDRTLFLKPLSEAQKIGMRDVLDSWYGSYPNGDPRWLAYILASIYHETGQRMVPVREGFKPTDGEAREHVRNMFIRGKVKRDYAVPVDGISYFGRGRVQTTHFDNYRKLMRRFNHNFVDEPNLLLDSRIDADVAVVGHVEGLWTKFKLADFIQNGRCDYVGARRIVNGQDRAPEIASFASAFERAVKSALPAVPPVAAATAPDQPAADPQGDTDMASTDAEIKDKIDRLTEMLGSVLGAGKPPADGAEAGAGAAADAERIKAIEEFIVRFSNGANSNLTPVNAALGETIGRLLNGKKSAIGIVGAMLTTIIGQSGSASPLGAIVDTVTKALPFLAGLSGPVLPIFLALAAWGFLGKQEKLLRNKSPSQ